MKIKSVAGITCYIKSLNKTADFYELLGFDIKKRDSTHLTAYSNWFWIDFIAVSKEARPQFKKEATQKKKGTALFIYLGVDDVDGFHRELVGRGLKPVSAPTDSPSGNREFILRDPDGYNLVIFKRK